MTGAEKAKLPKKDEVEELRVALDKLDELRPLIKGILWILDDMREQQSEEEFAISIAEAKEAADAEWLEKGN